MGYPLDTRGPPCYTPPMGAQPPHRWTPAQIIQALMAVSSLAAIIFLAVTGQPVPDVLVALLSGISAFYFGQITAANRTAPRPPPGG